MRLVPVPATYEYVCGTEAHWLPFLTLVRRWGDDPDEIAHRIYNLNLQVILAWDEEAQTVPAIALIEYLTEGDHLVGQMRGIMGAGHKSWQGMLPELEQYLTELGCAKIRMYARFGWLPLLKGAGYRAKRIVMEKDYGRRR